MRSVYVAADATRFHHALIGFDKETIEFASDMLEEYSYVRLKEQLIWRPSVSEEGKLNQLLNELTLGDRTFSQLLRELKRLGRDKVDSELLKSLWL